MLLNRLDDVAAFARRLGYEVRSEGLCRDEMCVPLPSDPTVQHVAERLRMPLVEDTETGLWALGPPADGKVLASAVAPDLVLPDVDGTPFALRSLRGAKVLLLAWASW